MRSSLNSLYMPKISDFATVTTIPDGAMIPILINDPNPANRNKKAPVSAIIGKSVQSAEFTDTSDGKKMIITFTDGTSLEALLSAKIVFDPNQFTGDGKTLETKLTIPQLNDHESRLQALENFMVI